MNGCKAKKTRTFLHEQEKEQLISLCDLCTELTEIEAEAAKWDMIQWAIDKKIRVTRGPGYITIGTIIEFLEQLYKEREKE